MKPRTRKRRTRQKQEPRKGHVFYTRSLNRLIDMLFEEAYNRHMTWSKLAEASGLSYSTIQKLGRRETLYPQYRTVELLAKALGGSVQFRKGKNTQFTATWKPRLFDGRRREVA